MLYRPIFATMWLARIGFLAENEVSWGSTSQKEEHARASRSERCHLRRLHALRVTRPASLSLKFKRHTERNESCRVATERTNREPLYRPHSRPPSLGRHERDRTLHHGRRVYTLARHAHVEEDVCARRVEEARDREALVALVRERRFGHPAHGRRREADEGPVVEDETARLPACADKRETCERRAKDQGSARKAGGDGERRTLDCEGVLSARLLELDLEAEPFERALSAMRDGLPRSRDEPVRVEEEAERDRNGGEVR